MNLHGPGKKRDLPPARALRVSKYPGESLLHLRVTTRDSPVNRWIFPPKNVPRGAIGRDWSVTDLGFVRQTRATAPRVGHGDVYADGFFIHPNASPRDDETTRRRRGTVDRSKHPRIIYFIASSLRRVNKREGILRAPTGKGFHAATRGRALRDDDGEEARTYAR